MESFKILIEHTHWKSYRLNLDGVDLSLQTGVIHELPKKWLPVAQAHQKVADQFTCVIELEVDGVLTSNFKDLATL